MTFVGLKRRLTRPLIDVIVPAYNSELTLGNCIASLQLDKNPWLRVLLVNDGSSDRTSEIMREIASRFPNVSIFEQENQGLSAARNLGLENATSEYVLFLDADDALRPHKLKKVLSVARAGISDLVMFDTEVFSEGPEFSSSYLEERRRYYSRSFFVKRGQAVGPERVRELMRKGSYLPSACLYISRRGFLEEIQARFEPGLTFEDHPFTFYLLLKARSTRYVRVKAHRRQLLRSSITHTLLPLEASRHLSKAVGLLEGIAASVYGQNLPSHILQFLERLRHRVRALKVSDPD